MITIKILGPGCANCTRLEAAVRSVVERMGLLARIQKITNYLEMTKYPIEHTPGLVINERLVASGSVPSESEIAAWIAQAGA